MFVFILDEIHSFVDAVSILAGLGYVFNLKFSPEMFSIMANPTPSPCCTIALQPFPPFFNQQYSCQQLHYSWIYINHFFPEMFDLERTGFSSLTFSFADSEHADLTFCSRDGRFREIDFPMYRHSDESMDVSDQLDWETFVSFNSQEFINIVRLNNFDSGDARDSVSSTVRSLDNLPLDTQKIPSIRYDAFFSMETELFKTLIRDLNDHTARVTVARSSVRFTSSKMLNIGFTRQSGNCIIGGIKKVGDEIKFTITFRPVQFFTGFSTKRVWFFRPSLSNCIAMISPVNLHAEITSYFV